ncbi:hypothetical protein ABK040_002669 [Willaertia magna]
MFLSNKHQRGKQETNELRSQIKQQLNNLKQENKTDSSSEMNDFNENIIMDEFGNLIDERGNIIQQPKKSTPTTKINQKRLQEEKRKSLKIEKPPNVKKQEYYDPSLYIPKAEPKKRKRAFVFHEKGEFIEKAKLMRELEEEEHKKALEKQEQEKLKKEQEKLEKEKEKERQLQEERELSELHLMLGCRKLEDFVVPDVYWWDSKILATKSSTNISPNSEIVNPYERDFDNNENVFKIREKLVLHNFIEHPIQVEPLKKKSEGKPIPLMLTKKEQKKLTTKIRIQKEKEKQRKINLGLLPAPAPKANLKNYMRALLANGEDPTELEMRIKKEIDERVKAHEERMASQKLTKEQKIEKKLRKINEDAEVELLASVYAIPNISHPQTRFKINTAKEKGITGAVFIAMNKPSNGRLLLIAEGGRKALKKYDDTILRRIDFSKDEKEEQGEGNNESEDFSQSGPQAKLLWKGAILKRNFTYFKFQQFEDEDSVKKYLQDNECGHYYDIFINDANLPNELPLI